MQKKETIVPPTKQVVKQGSQQLKKGLSSGGRLMSEAATAKREGVKKR